MTIAPNMYYIQRLVICSSQPKGEKDTTLLISGDYMGSAEFEFGSVTNSWQFLTTINPLEPTKFGTISGIYDDNTVVIKYTHRKTLRVPYDYVLPESLYNEYIKEGMNTSV